MWVLISYRHIFIDKFCASTSKFSCQILKYLPSEYTTIVQQKVQNRAARLVFKANRREHTTPLLRKLHWLPVCERIKFKLTLAYKSKHETTPPYIQNLLKPQNYSDGNMFLRSHADDNLLVCNIELAPHMETMPFAMLCQLSRTIGHLDHLVLLTVLQLLNPI